MTSLDTLRADLEIARTQIDRLERQRLDDKMAMQTALVALRMPCDRWNSAQTKLINNAIQTLTARLGK